MEKISVIVPAYNEENTLGELLERLGKVNLKMDVLVVDDGSRDRTSEVARKAGFKILRHEKNRGKGAALRSGIDAVEGGIIVFQDADLEYGPEEIPKLIEPILKKEANVVYGSRFLGKINGMKKSHYLGNRFLSFATSLLFKTKITDMETGYKIFAPGVIQSLELESNGFEIEPEITAKLIKKGYKIVEIPITFKAREKGEKKISWIDGVNGFFKLIKYFCQLPRTEM